MATYKTGIAQITIRQRDFSAGEISPDAERREDRDEFKFGVRYARNLQSNKAGNLEQRPGRRRLYSDDGVRDEFKPFPDNVFSITFSGSRFTARREDGSIAAQLTAPWGDDEIETLVWEAFNNLIFVCWSGRTQVITVDRDTFAWTIEPYAFGIGLNSARRSPFYRFGGKGITLAPGGRTGSVSVTFSGAVLDPEHVGVAFRYAGRQLLITAVSDSRHGTATCTEELPPSYRLTLDSVDGFAIGQICETDVTSVKCEVASINVAAKTVDVVCIDSFTSISTGENLTGPSSFSKISEKTEISPAATVQWDEEFISDYRGWPRSVSKDSQRLIFANFAQFKNAIVWSAVSDPFDLDIGADADNAIFEYVDAECQVFHVIGGYDEFAITDTGVYYIPVSSGNPLQPGSVEFRLIYSGEISNVRPAQVTEGVLFVDETGTGIYSITATGQTARPYLATEINDLHRHLFDDIKAIAVSSGSAVFPARQIFVVNGDGTVVIGQYNADRQYVGWLKWDGAGAVRSVVARYGQVIFTTKYTFGGVDSWVAEANDQSILCDCATTFDVGESLDFLTLYDGTPLLLSDGSRLSLGDLVTSFYANKTVDVFADGFYLGAKEIGAEGTVPDVASFSSVTIGVRYEWSLKPNLEDVEGGQAFGQRERRRKIAKALIRVRETQEFQVGNKILGSYRAGEDMAQPVPRRTDTYRYKQLGRSWDPEYEIRSTFPAWFKLVELTTRITV